MPAYTTGNGMKWIGLLVLFSAQAALGGAAFVDFDLGLIFPQKLGGMACDRVENYSNEEMGYSVFYSLGGGITAEVSVLDLGRRDIGTGYKADGVDVILQALEVQLERREKLKEIAKWKKRGSTVIPRNGDVQFANNVYQYAEPREDAGIAGTVTRILSVYVTAAHNHFIRVDLLFDIGDNTTARKITEALVPQMVTLIQAGHSEQELLLAGCDALVYNPSDYAGRLAARRILEKTQTMADLAIYDAFFVWSEQSEWERPKNFELLEAAYYAGMLKAVLPQNLSEGGDQEAFVAMLEAYAAMRKRDDIKAIPQLEEWVKAPDKKALYKKLLIEFEYVLPSD